VKSGEKAWPVTIPAFEMARADVPGKRPGSKLKNSYAVPARTNPSVVPVAGENAPPATTPKSLIPSAPRSSGA
jgi:hypothetical protein